MMPNGAHRPLTYLLVMVTTFLIAVGDAECCTRNETMSQRVALASAAHYSISCATSCNPTRYCITQSG